MIYAGTYFCAQHHMTCMKNSNIIKCSCNFNKFMIFKIHEKRQKYHSKEPKETYFHKLKFRETGFHKILDPNHLSKKDFPGV